jgi:hypothetical protein
MRSIEDNDEIFLFNNFDFSADIAGCVAGEDFKHERTDIGDAEEVWKVVVQDRHIRSGDNELSTGWDVQS